MDRYVLLVESNCKDPNREEEFNEWYSKIHIPDIMTNRQCIKASRWIDISPTPVKGKYLALYEIETDDFNQTKKAIDENVARLKTQGRGSDLIVGVSHRVFRQIFNLSK